MMAYLSDRIRERVDAMQAKEVARMYREFAQSSDDPDVRQLAKGFAECEAGFQEIVDGKASYV
jgi:hypothetical protein